MIRSNWIKLLSARAYVIHRKHSFVYKYSSMMTSSSPLARYSQNLFSKIGRAKETSLLRPFSKASYLKTSTGVFRKVFMVGGDGFTAKYSFKHGDYQLTKDDDCAHTIMRLQCIFDILGMMTTQKILLSLTFLLSTSLCKRIKSSYHTLELSNFSFLFDLLMLGVYLIYF